MGDVFGGSTVKSKSTTDNAQKGLRRQIIDDLGLAIEGIPDELFPTFGRFDQGFPGLTQGQQTSLAALEQQALAGAEGGARANTIGNARNAIDNILGETTDFDEFFRTNVADPLLETLREDFVPERLRSSVRTGSLFGGENTRAVDTLFENAADTLGRERARLALETRRLDRQQQLDATSLLPALEAIEPALLTSILQAGDLERQAGIQQVGFDFGKFQSEQDRINQLLALAASLSTARTVDNVNQQNPNLPGEISNALSSAGSFMQGLGSLSGGGGGGGGGAGIAAMFCWAAAAHYGWLTPEWFNARYWIVEQWPSKSILGRLFLHAYARWGQTWGRWIAEYRIVKWATRPFFNWAVRKGE